VIFRAIFLSAILLATGSLWADAFEANARLGRGVNLGNALDAPKEGEWGFKLEAEYFDLIKKAGFNSVRIPIRWSVHAGAEAPYTIDPEFFKRVDWAVEQALSRGLNAVINVHHYEEMFQDPAKHQPRLEGLWKQIAERYRDRSEQLYFEILNEPHGKLTPWDWQKMIPALLGVIRQSNPHRMVIIGPGEWNGLWHLESLKLSDKDPNLIVTFHYYSPFEFTHQSASWVAGSEKWKGTTWDGNAAQMDELRKHIELAAAWGKKNKRPLYLGEFGAFSAADMDSRARWTRAITREAEKHRISWAYWEFGSGFGIYDPAAKEWRRPLLEALTEKAKP
jgi:endoglucanase